MAVIRPFKALRYNLGLIGDLGKVITPPYDVIDADEQERLHQKSHYNIVRLEYGKTYPGDNYSDNRYTRAADTLQKWLEKKILIPDRLSAYYIYEQSYTYKQKKYRRRGIMAALKLEPYGEKVILPHELTMSGPKKDRLELLRRIQANVSPIFTLFPDPEDRMEELIAEAIKTGPICEAVEESGQSHRLWAFSDPNGQDIPGACLAGQPLLIADGHHRYETALLNV